ncbi:MAG: sugar phosphate isomerase/epimerase [Bacteroidetes bacterium]|nr:sugar phosphate isomerase/epimerase [Bacteroidota bacterium]
MELKYCCTYWGCENMPPGDFLQKARKEGYDGVEINMPDNSLYVEEFLSSIHNIKTEGNPAFVFIAQQVLALQKESADVYRKKMEKRLTELALMRPLFINSHTGKDYYTFEENCRIIEIAENIAAKTGVPVYHEIHRGRFTFHLQMLLPYLQKFPGIKLCGDISHWCAVSESMLQDQEEALYKTFPHIHHIHARIGSEQSPQVNDPFAPEWVMHLEIFTNWWQKILYLHKDQQASFTITPEIGPSPYMPVMPYSQLPLCDQWKTNLKMKSFLKSRFIH